MTVIIEDIEVSSNYSNIIINKKKRTKTTLDNVISVFIASPSDVGTERELLLNSLETKFRRDNFENQCGYRIIIHSWEELPSQVGYGQDLINDLLLKKADIIVAVFKHKLGTPIQDQSTNIQRSVSGTAEELLYAINKTSNPNAPLGMAYFYSEAPTMSFESMDFDKTLNEWKRLKEFKESIKGKILYKQYKSSEDLLDKVCRDLCQNIEQNFSK